MVRHALKARGEGSRKDAKHVELLYSYCGSHARTACCGYGRCRPTAGSGWGDVDGDGDGEFEFEARSGVGMMQSTRPDAWPLSRDHVL